MQEEKDVSGTVSKVHNYNFGVSVDRIFAYGDSEDRATYNSTDRNKLDWDIHFGDDGRVTVSDGVFTPWP